LKNIIFKELKIQNFLSFGKEVTIPFTKGINLITGINHDKDDANGVGKSVIIDAFFFVLFGETIKSLKKDGIINHFAKKDCKVTLTFDINKNGTITSYIVERGLAPSYCKLFVNKQENKTLSTIPVTNNYILNLINSTPAVFRNIITMSANNTTPFMALGKPAKKEFIEGLLRLELFRIMNKVAKEDYDTMFKEYEMVIQSYEENNRNICTYIERKTNFEKSRVDKIQDLKQRKETYEKEIINLEKRIIPVDNHALNKTLVSLETNLHEQTIQHLTLVKEITTLETQENIRKDSQTKHNIKARNIAAVYNSLPKLSHPPKSIEECSERIETESKHIDKLNSQLIELQGDIKHLTADIDRILQFGSICDKCKRPFPENDVQKNETDLKAINQLIKEKSQSRSDIAALISTTSTIVSTLRVIEQVFELKAEKIQINQESNQKILDAKHSTLEILKTEMDSTKNQLKLANEEMDKLTTQFQQNIALTGLIENHEKSIKQCDEDIQKISTEKNEFEDMINTSETRKQEMEKKIEGYKEQIAIYETIKFVVSDTGVKAYIVKKLLTILNSRIDYYLTKLDANCKLTFNEYFEDYIINDKNIECSYHNFSGGEQRRIDLACLFAFMDLRRIQGDVAFNISFFDELIDSALSAGGSSKVFDILKERVDKHNEWAYIITHNKNNMNNSLITNTIFLEKIGGITKLGKPK